MKPVNFLLLTVIMYCFPAAGEENDTLRRVFAVKVAPCYDAPGSVLPLSYANRNDTCSLLGTEIDSTGTPWFELGCPDSSTVWSPAKNWHYVHDAGYEGQSEPILKDETDRKRRLSILQENRDWPRRIIRAVRDGVVCLDMTPRQLYAAWGEPVQKSAAFTIGLGNYETWFYTGRGGSLQIVALKGDRVVGWTVSDGKGHENRQ